MVYDDDDDADVSDGKNVELFVRVAARTTLIRKG